MPKILYSLLLICFGMASIQGQIAPADSIQKHDSTKGLKDYYASYFTMGVAISPHATHTDEAALIRKHFASITAENAMKMKPIHPEENRYNWGGADSIMHFAEQNYLKVRGHTLCWHQQAPEWMFKDKHGKQVTKKVLLQRLKEHITAVVGRYKGRIYAWDVVNEAVSDNPREYLRDSEWFKICGEEYIAKAFQYAHEADPQAELYYNDYNELNPMKREKIWRLVKTLKDAGVPIHGVGLQGHWAFNEPSAETLDSTIKRFSDLGLKVQITELDVSIYKKEHDAGKLKATDSDTRFTAERDQLQAGRYKIIFDVLRKYKNVISAVTFWNLSDRRSWLDNFPVRGRKDYPLLFDKNLRPKTSYYAVTNF